jgi:hypothetical protein
MSKTISLSPRIYRRAKSLAQERGTTDPRVYGKTVEDPERDPRRDHLLGILGELAFASYYDINVNTGDRPDPGYDFLLEVDGTRRKIDIKTIRYSDGFLPVDADPLQADLYVLAYSPDSDSREVRLLGVASSATVSKSPKERANKSKTLIYRVQQSELSPLPDQSSVQPRSKY